MFQGRLVQLAALTNVNVVTPLSEKSLTAYVYAVSVAGESHVTVSVVMPAAMATFCGSVG